MDVKASELTMLEQLLHAICDQDANILSASELQLKQLEEANLPFLISALCCLVEN